MKNLVLIVYFLLLSINITYAAETSIVGNNDNNTEVEKLETVSLQNTSTPSETTPNNALEENNTNNDELVMQNMMRQGSGTSWQPMDNPMLMTSGHIGPLTTMLHWDGFLTYDHQGGQRGREKLISQNWFMGSLSTQWNSNNYIQARAMMSMEPLTIGKVGYPLLFQTGEAINGRPLIDIQHPHDMFMDLSVQYWHRLMNNNWGFIYVAPVGEPALGPIAAPHRYSALLFPDAPLSHHIMDATHVSFGVITAGLALNNKWQWEGSIFNGKEPDSNRYNFHFAALNSFSTRLTHAFNNHWVAQTSFGFLDKPERLESINQSRLTSSIQHSKTWDTGWWASLLSYGHNFHHGADENGVLLESTIQFKNKNYVFGRIENVQKHGFFTIKPETSANITAISLGLARDLFQIKGVPLTLGAMITCYAKGNQINQIYGDFPVSFQIFLHTNAPRMRMMGM